MDDELRAAVLQLKRDRIVAAALDLFDARGYVNTTLDDLAAHLSVSKPFIYAHFRSKGELLAVICTQGIAISMAVIDCALATPGAVPERLARFAHDFVLAVLASQKHVAIYAREETSLDASDREAIRKLRKEFDRKLVVLLDEGVARGELQLVETPITALAVGGIVSWASTWFRDSGRLPQEQVAQTLSTLVMAMAGVAPQHGSTPQALPRVAGARRPAPLPALSL